MNNHTDNSNQLLGVEAKPNQALPADPNEKILALRDLKLFFPVKTGVFKKTTGHVKAVDGIDLIFIKVRYLALWVKVVAAKRHWEKRFCSSLSQQVARSIIKAQ